MNKKVKLALILSSTLLAINLFARGAGPSPPKGHKTIQAGAPIADFTVSDSLICVGSSVTFTDLSSNIPTSWNWTFPGGTPPTSILQNPTVTYSTAGTYAVTLMATNGAGSSTLTKNNYIVVNSIPTIIVNGSASICQGNADTLTATGATSYVWNTTATTSSIIVSPSATTTYSVIGTNLNCEDSATFTVTVFPTPTITISGNDSICFNKSTQLQASGAVNYTWAPSNGLNCTSCPNPTANPAVTTVYTIIGTDNNGCSNAITYTVYVIPPATVAASVSNRRPCTGVPVTLSAIGSPAGGTYLWQPGNKSGQVVIDTPLTNTTYTVSYITECDTATDTVSVFVSVTPTVFFTTTFRKGCVPLCTQFSPTIVPANTVVTSWSWDFGDGGTSSVKNPPYCYNRPGKYVAVLSIQTNSGCGSTGSNTDTIVVNPLPSAAFSYSPDPVTIVDPLVSFTNESTGSRIINWYWNFGDNPDSASYSQNPTHLYLDTGRYCAIFGIEDINGCVDTTTQCIEVGTQFTFYIPSAFTPNNDGVNDVFMPRGTDIGAYEMYIFDRWGMKIFYSNSIDAGWNGGVNNKGSKICQEDVYIYLINVTDTKGVQHHYSGKVTLLK